MIYDLPAKLRSERSKAKKSQREIGEIIGLSKSAVSQYENGYSSPPPNALAKLARYYRVSADYLLGIDMHRTVSVDGLDENEIEAVKHIISAMQHLKGVK